MERPRAHETRARQLFGKLVQTHYRGMRWVGPQKEAIVSEPFEDVVRVRRVDDHPPAACKDSKRLAEHASQQRQVEMFGEIRGDHEVKDTIGKW
jgi:hypothetical protein